MDSVIVFVPFPNVCPARDNNAAPKSLLGKGCSSSFGSKGTKQPSNSKPIHGIRFSKPKAKFAAVNDIPREIGKSTFIQDNINLGDLRKNMDRIMEDDMVLDINTDYCGNKTLKENSECSSSSQLEGNSHVTRSVWERFKEVKKSSTIDSESNEDEVYSPDYHKSNYVASASGEFTLEDDDLDCYDGYEAQLYDIPDEMQNFCDNFDIRLKSRVRLVPSCFVIFDLEPLSLSFDFVFVSEIFKSLSFRLDRLFRLAILCLDQHAHTLHHHESLLTISLDRLDIFEGRSCISEFVRKSLSFILEAFMILDILMLILAIKVRGRLLALSIRTDLNSLKGLQAQSVGSSNTDVLDLPCLLVLITGTSQSRQHGKSESDSYYLSD
ncbi:hypothetical protein Tco_1313710 [Tanacetum coccineum]